MNVTPDDSQKSTRNRWLCIAAAFPPINRSGTHRTLGFVRHLSDMGWDATVICDHADEHTADGDLLNLVPADTDIRRCHAPHPVKLMKRGIQRLRTKVHWQRAEQNTTGIRSGSTTTSPAQETSKSNRSIKDWLTRLAMTPDDHSLWVFNALRATLTAIRESKPKLLYSTSPCMSAHLVGLVASHITRLPWIVDLRDPWRGNPFRDLGYRTLDAWDAWLEQRVLRRASHVICNTPTATEALKKRKPWLTARCSTILNGFDSEILTDVVPQRTQPKRTFVFAHAGQFYGRRRPEPWFRALRILLDAHDLGSGEDVRNIRMTLIGNPTCDGISLETIAEREDVRQHVDILGNMNHNAALCHLAGSDAVMLAGATGPGADLQVPNKLFEYLALKRPILAGLAATNPARQILTEASARAECCDPDDPKQIAEAMQRILRQPGTEGQFRNADRFGRRFRALELLSIFHRVATLDPSHARTVAAGTASREDMLEARTTAFDDVSNHAYRR